MKTLKEINLELQALETRKELLEALDKYDEILIGAGVNREVIEGARESFTKWEERFEERY